MINILRNIFIKHICVYEGNKLYAFFSAAGCSCTLASSALSQASLASFWTAISRLRSLRHWSSLSRHSVMCRTLGIEHRRRINTEEKAQVVAAVWGTELLIQFLAVLAILH